jgi:hypothetical protein
MIHEFERIAGDHQEWMDDHLSADTYEKDIIADIKKVVYGRDFKKYVVTGAPLSLLSPIYPAANPDYWWGRAHDDMADGDMTLPVGVATYGEYVSVCKHHLETDFKDMQKGVGLDFLLKRVVQKTEREQRPSDNVREELGLFLDAMLTENTRRLQKQVLTRKELYDLNEGSFRHAHNIMLIAIRSPDRASDIPELFQLQGSMYALDDLPTEIPKGTCNIPAEVLDEGKLTLDELITNPNLFFKNTVIGQWVKEEITMGKILYAALEEKIPSLSPITRFYIYYLVKGVEKRIRKAERMGFAIS